MRSIRIGSYRFKPRFFVIMLVALLIVVLLITGIVKLVKRDNGAGSTNSGPVVAISSGHDSAADPGAGPYGDVWEYQLNDAIAKALQKELESRGYKVIQVRQLNSKDEKSQQERAKIINDSWPDIFISLNQNSNQDQSAAGFTLVYNDEKIDTYDGDYLRYQNGVYKIQSQADGVIHYMSGSKTKKLNTAKNEGKYEVFTLNKDEQITESIRLAESLYTQMSELAFISPFSDSKENTVLAQNMQLLRLTHSVGIEVQCGYMSNEAELAELLKEENQTALCKAVADGIDRYFNAGE